MLKSIRDITHQVIDRDLLESYYTERDRLKKKKKTTIDEKRRIKELQDNIYSMMYIPQYITVTMDSVPDYEELYHNGFYFNHRWYKRMSCSASQARVSTVVFCDCGSDTDTEESPTSIRNLLKQRLDNGRDLSHPLAASKYNAYLGLYSSASKKVTTPRYCIVPDFISTRPVDVSWSIETDWEIDDIIEDRTVDVEFNRFDGSGLISPQMAEIWSLDLEEPYTPSQFCIRYSFTKGLVNVFDFVEWCHDELEGIKPEEEKYFITDIYGNQVDLRNIDVVLTEGMAKLWDSWVSQESLEDNSAKNGIEWRVTKYAPQHDKLVSTMNYQYIQTLNLSDDSIKALCKDTIDYLQGVSYDNIYYTLLFLMGDKVDIDSFLKQSDNYWLKALLLNHNLLNDKYTKDKIRNLIKKKIELACLGRIQVRGNYQAIVPDHYGLMQWITGQTVTGLLKDGEVYSQYWLNRGVTKIGCARSPQTWRGEWCSMIIPTLPSNGQLSISSSEYERIEKINKYFKYSYSGIITNIIGEYTLTWAGSDFDFDLLFTSDSKNVIDSMYQNEKVTLYDVPKPKKKPNLSEDDLFRADYFSFGQQIGPLTNISTSIYALLPYFEGGSEDKSETEEMNKKYEILISRLKQCCVNQSKQIDKSKLGIPVKCIPKLWNVYKHPPKPPETETPEETQSRDFYNSIIADRKPYFFRYKYTQLDKEYRKYIRKRDESSRAKFGSSVGLSELLSIPQENLTEEQKAFIFFYKKQLPVNDSPCVMNKLCHYIESVDFEIKKKVHSSYGFDPSLLQSEGFQPNKKIYEQIKRTVDSHITKWAEFKEITDKTKAGSEGFDKFSAYTALKEDLAEISPNDEVIANHLITLFYIDKPSYNKNIIWDNYGKTIYRILRQKTNEVYYPKKNENGSITFLGENYSVERIELDPIEGTPYDLEAEIREFDSISDESDQLQF